MVEQPVGTVTLVFTDIEGSTRLLDDLGQDAYRDALAEHRRIVREAFSVGYEVDNEGDAFFYAFASALDAIAAVEQAMRGLDGGPIRIRVSVHTGEPGLDPPKYVGRDVHRATRIMAAGHGGQVLVSDEAARLVRRTATLRDLGEHLLKDFPERQRLWQLCTEGLVSDFPPLKTLDAIKTNLPLTVNALLGRRNEVDEVVELLADGFRMVTVTGPGGTGKTRLAIEVGRELTDRFRDGVHWVPLAGLRDPELVLPTISHTLAARDDLSAHLQHQDALLVLDNFEHVQAASASVGELLGAAPRLKLLVTSRAPLRVGAEHVYPLEPLQTSAAEALFAERAAAAGGRVHVGGAVRRICERVDCLPLAVELAAARTRLLDPDSLLARLEKSLAVLTHGATDAPERQRTLRATIEWSYALLGDEARRLLERLSVFAGGFTLDLAEEVADADLDALSELVDLSLLKQRPGARFLMLETIREFAAERLDEAGATDGVRRRHAEAVLGLAEIEAPRVREHGELERIEADHDNVRIALAWARDSGAAETGARLAAAVARYWYFRSLAIEARRWLEPYLADVDQFDPLTAARLVRAGLEIACVAGDFVTAGALADDAYARWLELGDPRAAAESLNDIGAVASFAGDLDRASAFLERGREAARAAGDTRVLSYTLANAAEVEVWRGARHRARALADEAKALAGTETTVGPDVRAILLLAVGLGAYSSDDLEESRHALQEAAKLCSHIDYLAWQVFEALAAVLVRIGRDEDGAVLIGAAQAVLVQTGAVEQTFYAQWSDRTIAAIREALGEGADAAFTRGREMELNEAIAFAQQTGP